MQTPSTPHYHVVCRGGGEVWTYFDRQPIRTIGYRMVAGGRPVDFFACVGKTTCPDEIMYRWEKGRVPTKTKPLIGRHRPRKTIAFDRKRVKRWRAMDVLEDLDEQSYGEAVLPRSHGDEGLL